MKELRSEQLDNVNGGLVPAIYAGFMAYNYAVAVYGGANVAAFGASAAIAFYTYLD
jgi:lactobin A/cerein 7B family class IIb bacteriocin